MLSLKGDDHTMKQFLLLSPKDKMKKIALTIFTVLIVVVSVYITISCAKNIIYLLDDEQFKNHIKNQSYSNTDYHIDSINIDTDSVYFSPIYYFAPYNIIRPKNISIYIHVDSERNNQDGFFQYTNDVAYECKNYINSHLLSKFYRTECLCLNFVLDHNNDICYYDYADRTEPDTFHEGSMFDSVTIQTNQFKNDDLNCFCDCKMIEWCSHEWCDPAYDFSSFYDLKYLKLKLPISPETKDQLSYIKEQLGDDCEVYFFDEKIG